MTSKNKIEIDISKVFQVTATMVTQYSKNIIFNSADTNTWYDYDEDAEDNKLTWGALSNSRRVAILEAFKEDLENISIDPGLDPDVYEEGKDWDQELMICEL